MRLKLKKLELSAGRPIIFINKDDAKSIDINTGDRIEVSANNKKITGRVDIMSNYLKRGEIALSSELTEYLKTKVSQDINVNQFTKPDSSNFITKKMNKKELSKSEIHAIISDVVNNVLSEAEIAQFIVAVYTNKMSTKETVYLTEAMAQTGTILKWDSKIITDKHCIGGIAGNRTTPIVVAICAAAGAIMPKTSSRAITSAAGTADTMETITKVNFSSNDLKRIVKKTGACLAWGGSLGISPADDKLIQIERMLRVDPESQLIASILSKKIAAGSNHILIDIPYGENAKVSKGKAEHLKEKFIEIGKHFNLKIKVIPTNGNQPIGNGIGPILEMIDVLKVLNRKNPPIDLENKSIMLSGQILEMIKKAPLGQGEKLAREILDSGRAIAKFNEIINAQGLINTKLEPAKYSFSVKARKSGKVVMIENHKINSLAYVLGCPIDKAAGIYIHRKVNEKIKIGESLLTFYSESKEKLLEAQYLFKQYPPIIIK